MVLPQDAPQSLVAFFCLWKQSGWVWMRTSLSIRGTCERVRKCAFSLWIIKLIFHPSNVNCLILSYCDWKPKILAWHQYRELVHEWVKCADNGYGFGALGALEGSSETIMTAWDSVRWMGWEGGGDLGWRSICLASSQEKRDFELVPFSQTCSAPKACEDMGHMGLGRLPPCHTIVFRS